MKLVPNAGEILTRSHSAWLGAWAPLGVLSVPELFYMFLGWEVSPVMAWALAFLCAIAFPYFRVKAQGIDHDR